jgi:hypothetical protein
MATPAQTTTDPIPVNVENYDRAESDISMAGGVKAGRFGKFVHLREPMPLDKQIVVRPNRDTLYSVAVFDLDAGPVTITLPDASGRFISLQVIDEDQYTFAVYYDSGDYSLTKEKIGTRYINVIIRILVDPNDAKDVTEVHALQEAIKVDQPGGPGKFEVPNWDHTSLLKVREALITLGGSISSVGMFGARGEVDPVKHLIGTAVGWGGNPDKDAVYVLVVPPNNDGKTAYKLTVPADVPVDGFWSISLYNEKGYFEKNDFDAYSLNNVIAKKAADGSVNIRFGGDSKSADNYLPIMPGWNYTVRLYRPRKEILDGTWKFPEAQPVS